MKPIQFNYTGAISSIPAEEIASWEESSRQSLETLHSGKGAGNSFLGWLRLPSSIIAGELEEIELAAAKMREQCETVVVIGIGGSYLGARAVIEALGNSFDMLQTPRKSPLILYAGHNICEDYLAELVDLLKGKSFGLINISKSGTTTEPALAFRILKKLLEESVGKAEARERVIAITDARRGALRNLADCEDYKTFVIPDSVGGRFSVLTPVGLLPIAIAGINIRELMSGARSMEKRTVPTVPFADNIASQYASVRNYLYKSGKKIEILANYHPKLHFLAEWWKQLYGESEGKQHKGIFPAAVDLTTDLHSMGQWIQEGERSIFETVISVATPARRVLVPKDKDDFDGLNYLAGKRVDAVNKMAELGTKLAHIDGGVPVLEIIVPELAPYNIGQLIYFFEKACAASGYILGVNPFDQPGVEAYKTNMFALLDKPGFEAQSEAVKARLK
ncbi:MAG: glucose-6-phosphate isomerase [Tannerellaceae bacterium]|jgi:glucose-6-phosphate isomerase|nr:glucose-6-phosphate isomerase [Tannerellaceae bacterium]